MAIATGSGRPLRAWTATRRRRWVPLASRRQKTATSRPPYVSDRSGRGSSRPKATVRCAAPHSGPGAKHNAPAMQRRLRLPLA
ncbi:hypothetical protein AZ78_1938 [Lysobacter capsici AZ78]|uniref:Uncharacterized protein n=1 Tax=Lysobacter capsici AZ78 TaxID=1444315 RepID=A0A108U8A9_9GAMM|nr:hypothetical protein AZ78_1938 [Lysobacter capsici AZ78]